LKVEFYRHQLGEEELNGVKEVLGSLFLTTGPKTREFEQSFAAYLGVDGCLGVTSWTMGNFITLKALDIGPGDKVLTTPLTYVATANTILHVGAEPVFADVDPITGNLDPEAARKALTANKGVKAMIVVHLYGQMADMKALSELAKEFGVFLIEDCAHCVEGVRDGVRPGQLSDAAAFSFYATKNMTCAEGGAIVTNNQSLLERIRPLRLHGVDTYAMDQRKDGIYRHWDMTELGYKCNMHDLSAALLLPQLARIEETRKSRERLCKRYDKLLQGLDSIEIIPEIAGSTHACHLYTIRVDPGKRDRMLTELSLRGVGVGVNFRVVHLMAYYVERFGFEEGIFPMAERIGASTISLPLYPALREEEQEYVVGTIKSILSEIGN
jgi:dTDP-4-amino-4,6-dideoxygalactose transaminase